MGSMHFASKQQTAPALLPMGGQRRQVQHHEGAARFAVGGCASEGRLEEIGELLIVVSDKFIFHESQDETGQIHTFELR
jgi:hypothetical protein